MAHLKNLFTGTWSYGSYRNDGVWLPSPNPENPSNNIGETEYIKIDPNKPATFSWAGWSKSIPSYVVIHSYHTNSDLTSYAKVSIDSLSQTAVNNSITFENADEADYIRLYFHGSGSATQYQPLGFNITQAGVFDDVAFKVIVKNDGISDIIFKTLMLKGEAGGTISSIEKTSSSGVVDTYTITLNDGTTSTFEVTNGSNIESIEKTATAGLIDTYTVTLTNGDTSTFEVKNGEDAQLYELPQNCVVGYDKEPELHSVTGQNGYVAFDAYGIKNVKVTGYTKQATTTGKNLLIDIGSQNITSQTTILSNYPLNAGTYTISFDSVNISSVLGYLNVNIPNNPYVRIDIPANISGRYNGTFTLTENTTISILCNGQSSGYHFSVSNMMIEAGSSPTSYEPYTGGIPSPNPNYPQDIIGYGTKEQDGTYTIDIEVTDNDDNVYNITASGLAYPLYDGDVLDFENSKVIRKNGCVDMGSLNWIKDNSTPNTQFYVSQFMSNTAKFYGNIYCEIYKGGNYSYSAIPDNYITAGNSQAVVILRARDDSKNTYTAQQFTEAVQGIYLVYELASLTEESVTISGDTSIVKNLRGWTQVDAWDVDVTLDAWYYSDVDFPDGYEEIDFPLDDLFYYQNGEYIDFPSSWGFVMGYVFDANNIRFVMNVTKHLKEGMTVNITRSGDLSLNTYAGAGDVGILSGFSANSVSWIPELGQIQINLTTSQPHGLTPNMLLGARVATGVLRIIFEEET